MPRNGRSDRAGAVRAAAFFSGRGKAALSSLAAAAGGGVTAKLGEAKANRANNQKTIIGSARQGPKTGSRYARLRAAVRHGLSEGLILRGRECISDLILRSLRSKRLEGWMQVRSLMPSFETRAKSAPSG